MNEMYNRIESLCKEHGINITQMCREADIPRGNLTDLKMGRTAALSTKNLVKISSYFAVSMDYLLGNVSEPFLFKDEKGILHIDDDALVGIKKEPTPEDERKRELDQLAAEIRDQTRKIKTAVDSMYKFYLSLRDLARGDMPIPHEIAFMPEQSESIDADIKNLIEKFLEKATPEEASAFWLRYEEIGREFRNQMDNPAETPYPTPEEIEAYGELAKNLVMQQFLSEKKPGAQASSARESGVG